MTNKSIRAEELVFAMGEVEYLDKIIIKLRKKISPEEFRGFGRLIYRLKEHLKIIQEHN